MLEFLNVHKCYPCRKSRGANRGAAFQSPAEVFALRDINLKIPRSSVVGVVGASGAGKSTLLRTANLLERPDTGQILFHGNDLMQLPSVELQQLRRKMGMIFQQFHLLSSKTVFENIALPLVLSRMPTTQLHQRVEELLELVGLADRQHAYPSELSGGQKQRVAIARALAPSPDVLLCDEPTSALDPETTLSILKLLREINQRFGVTIFFITHEIEVIKNLATQVVLMEQGAIIEEAEVVTFFRHPQSLLAKKFVEMAFWLQVPQEYQDRLIPPISPESTLEFLDEQGSFMRSGRVDYLLKLGFTGKSIDQPVITEIARRFHIDLSILSANIDSIGGKRFGFLLAELVGQKEDAAATIHFFKEHHIEVQVLGLLN